MAFPKRGTRGEAITDENQGPRQTPVCPTSALHSHQRQRQPTSHSDHSLGKTGTVWQTWGQLGREMPTDNRGWHNPGTVSVPKITLEQGLTPATEKLRHGIIFLRSLGGAGMGAQMVSLQSPGSGPCTLVIPGWTPQEAGLQDRVDL